MKQLLTNISRSNIMFKNISSYIISSTVFLPGFSLKLQLLQHRKTQMTEVADSLTNTVSTYQTTWRHMLEDRGLNTHCHNNLKSHTERQFADNDALFCNRKCLKCGRMSAAADKQFQLTTAAKLSA